MFVAESRVGRRLVGRLDRGADLFGALLEVCKTHGVTSAEVRGTGALESAELAEYDQEARVWRPTRRLNEGAELLSLLGSIAQQGGKSTLTARATVMRDRDAGIQLFGGHLLSARVFSLEFVLECFDDLTLRREVDASTGLTLWRSADGAAAASTTWADVAAASAQAPSPAPAAEDDLDDTLRAGDILMHVTFGRCEVQKIEGSYEFAHIRLKNGRLVRLSLDVIRLTPGVAEQGRRVFRAGV